MQSIYFDKTSTHPDDKAAAPALAVCDLEPHFPDKFG